MSRDRHPNPSYGPVAIATCAAVAGKEEDDLWVIDALERRGVAAVHAAWDDHRVDWPSFSLVVVRSTWDYPERRNEFLEWASQLRKVLNPLPILRWNTDKHYLDDLARAGLPVIPTHFVEPGGAFEPPPWPFVIKPAVSCGAKQTARYRAGDSREASKHVRGLQAAGRTVMVQPYLSNIESKGEAAVVFIGGTYSHSIRRGALLRHPGLVHGGEMVPLNVSAYQVTADERALAEQALAQVSKISSAVLYARVDLAPGPAGEPLILEVELTEPSLFLQFSRSGVERLADCVVSALANG